MQKGDWYYNAVQWAKTAGIASGTGDGKFEPNSLVTREQFAQFLYNYAGHPDVTGELDFADENKVLDWASHAMLWANQINCLTNGAVSPQGDTNSESSKAFAAAALILIRILGDKIRDTLR